MKTKLTLIGALLATLMVTDSAQAARRYPRYARPAGTAYRSGAPDFGKPIGPFLIVKERPLAPSAPLILPEPIPRDEPATSIEFVAEPPPVETLILPPPPPSPPPTFNPSVLP